MTQEEYRRVRHFEAVMSAWSLVWGVLSSSYSPSHADQLQKALTEMEKWIGSERTDFMKMVED